MKIKLPFMLLTLILVLLIDGCRKSDYVAKVGKCPQVDSTIPLNGARNVPLGQIVSATFNQKMNAATITSKSFTVVDATKSAELKVAIVVTGTVTYSGETATLTPSSPLSPGTTYTGTVTTDAMDLMGNALQTDYIWTFSTDVPPAVTTDPANNATGVALNKTIVLTFSAPMDSLTLKAPSTSITIKQGTVTVPGKYSFNGTNVSFTPTGNFAPFTVYTGTVTTGAKNIYGTSIFVDYVWNFTTIPQLTLGSNPIPGGTTSGAGTFTQGASVTVVATPSLGYSFLNWTEGTLVASTSANYQFTMAGNKTLAANFTAQYVVSALSNPLLGGTTSGGGTFNSGASVTVTASPAVGYTFTNWTDGLNVVSTSLSYQFTMSASRTLVANYAAISYTVAVSSNPLLGGITTGGGIFNTGGSVTVKAVPNTGFTFINWTEGATIVSTSATYLFTIVGNRTLVANYSATPYNVAVSSNPLAGGTTTGGGIFNAGTSVSVAAIANVGYSFSNWTEGTNIVSSTANFLFTIAANRILVANFTTISSGFSLNVSAVNGSVAKNPNLTTYTSGSSVQLTATANSGYQFSSWSVDATGSANPLTVNMNANKNITANFVLSTPPPFIPLVDLKSAERFGILSGVGISNNAGFSVINNMDVGISPGVRSSVTGFPPAIVVGGAIYASDDIAPPGTPAMLAQAKLDLTAAYLFAEGATAPAPATVSGDQGGKTLAPGIYKSTSTLLIQAGDLTLDGQGDPNATWIFQIASAFTTVGGAGGNVILTGGAQAKNIFWQTGSSAVIGDYTSFYGNVLALQSITMNSHATVVGRMLARNGAVVLTATNTINKP